MALSKKAKKIEKAYKELQYLSQDEKARAEYDEYIEAQILENMKINYATENGIKQGRIEGSRSEKIEIAKKMLLKNKDIKEIQELTELTEEEIKNIKLI